MVVKISSRVCVIVEQSFLFSVAAWSQMRTYSASVELNSVVSGDFVHAYLAVIKLN
jgi:hypothetical protein